MHLLPVPLLIKLHCLTTCEEQGTRERSRESTKLINKELSDLRNTWGKQYLWPLHARGACCHPRAPETRKVSRYGFYLPIVLLHTRSVIKSWLCDFLTSCMCQLKIPMIWRRALIVAIPKLEVIGDPKSYWPYLFYMSPSRFLRDSSTLMSNQSLTHCSCRSRRAFNTGVRP